MKKQLFLILGVAALLTACNNTEKPAEQTPAKETTVNVAVEQPKKTEVEPTGTKVQVNNNGVKINVQDPNGNKIEINGKNPK